jgi:hypothetical protein
LAGEVTVISSQELIDGYDILFSTDLRLAHEALLTLAAETAPDGWPTIQMIVRFARCYDVPLAELAGLCGFLVYRLGRRTVFCDARRNPEHVHRTSASRFSRRALVAYGFFNTAAQMNSRGGSAVH